MGRPAKHRICNPHPSPRFRDKVRLLNFLRGPDDDGWAAQFLIDGQWQPRNPAALGTKDWDEACELARDRYAIAAAGQPIVKHRTPAKPDGHERTFRVYAEPVIARLRQKAEEADALVPGKGHVHNVAARKIEKDLIPKWGEVPIDTITENMLNDWFADEYRVEDVEATTNKFGRQSRDETRQFIWKKAARTTLGNLDWAFREVWLEAVAQKVVDRRARPMIRRVDHGEEGEPRAFIDAAGVQAVARVMTDAWVHTTNGTDRKRHLRCYIALIASTGIRPGLEALRIKIGHVVFQTQGGHPVIIIRIFRHQGKHPKARGVVVYEGDCFDIRRLLTEHIAWRRSQGAADSDGLFTWPDGSLPYFRGIQRRVLIGAHALIDPETGDERVAYSFRRYFATKLVELGLSIAQIAEWLGTSSAMVEQHYNRFLTERNAHLVNGHQLRWQQRVIEIPMPLDDWDAVDDPEAANKARPQ
jgi:integrase